MAGQEIATYRLPFCPMHQRDNLAEVRGGDLEPEVRHTESELTNHRANVG